MISLVSKITKDKGRPFYQRKVWVAVKEVQKTLQPLRMLPAPDLANLTAYDSRNHDDAKSKIPQLKERDICC